MESADTTLDESAAIRVAADGPPVDARSRAGDGGAAGPRRWRSGERVVAVVVLMLLCALAVFADTGHQAISDEGVVLAQAELLARGAWSEPLPVPEADPEGRFPPVSGSEVRDGVVLPYVKHAVYPVVIAASRSLAGEFGPLLFAAVSTWLAALAAAAIAGRIDQRLRIAALLAMAFGPPIFYGALVIAHAPAGALVGGATLAVLRLSETNRARWIVPAVLAAVLVTLLRSEGLLAALALGATLALGAATGALPGTAAPRWDCWRRPDRLRILLASSGVAIGVAAVGAYLFDGWLAARLLGVGGVQTYDTVGSNFDLVGGRISSLWASMLDPSDRPGLAGGLALLAAAVAVIAVLVARRSGRPRIAVALLVGAAALSLVGLISGAGLVPGLFVAFPLLPAGWVALDRCALSSTTARLALGTTVLGAVAIWLPSYAEGGSSEWGGRFYQLLLPLAVPLAVVGLDRARARIAAADRDGARLAVAALVVITLCMSVAAIRERDDLRTRAQRTLELVLPALEGVEPASEPGPPPVIVTDRTGVGRYGWAALDRLRLMTVDGRSTTSVAPALEGLADAGVDRVGVLVDGATTAESVAGDDWSVVGSSALGGWSLHELSLR